MSRTYRRKSEKDRPSRKRLQWLKSEFMEWHSYAWSTFTLSYLTKLEPGTKTYQERMAEYHSDAGTTNFKEPGPSWYRKLTTERPLRRRNKNELRKFILDNDYEPMIESKGRLDYWT